MRARRAAAFLALGVPTEGTVPRRNQRPKVPAEKREQQLALAAAAVCDICWESIYPWQDINWDHVIPMAQGGARGGKNKRLTHSICNTVKGSRLNFTLRTVEERDALHDVVKTSTWVKLLRAWSGHPGDAADT